MFIVRKMTQKSTNYQSTEEQCNEHKIEPNGYENLNRWILLKHTNDNKSSFQTVAAGATSSTSLISAEQSLTTGERNSRTCSKHLNLDTATLSSKLCCFINESSSNLHWFIGVEQHDRYESEYFFGDPVTRPCQMWQRLSNGAHFVQLHLDTADQTKMSAQNKQQTLVYNSQKIKDYFINFINQTNSAVQWLSAL